PAVRSSYRYNDPATLPRRFWAEEGYIPADPRPQNFHCILWWNRPDEQPHLASAKEQLTITVNNNSRTLFSYTLVNQYILRLKLMQIYLNSIYFLSSIFYLSLFQWQHFLPWPSACVRAGSTNISVKNIL